MHTCKQNTTQQTAHKAQALQVQQFVTALAMQQQSKYYVNTVIMQCNKVHTMIKLTKIFSNPATGNNRVVTYGPYWVHLAHVEAFGASQTMNERGNWTPCGMVQVAGCPYTVKETPEELFALLGE